MRDILVPTKKELEIDNNPNNMTADPVSDPIVTNNIAWQEFDYTLNPDLDDELSEDTSSAKR